MRVIANKRFAYPATGPTREIGDIFEVPVRDANILITIKAVSPAPFPEEKKRTYKRRDMRAEDSATLTAEDK